MSEAAQTSKKKAGGSGSLQFSSKASAKMRSVEDLDRLVKVTTPNMWAVLGAVLALVLGLLVWGILGSVSTNVQATAIVDGKAPVCFLPAESRAEVQEGNAATIEGKETKVVRISEVPLSSEEIAEIAGSDFLASSLSNETGWGYEVTFEPVDGLGEGVPLSVAITTDRIAPVSLIFGR